MIETLKSLLKVIDKKLPQYGKIEFVMCQGQVSDIIIEDKHRFPLVKKNKI